MLLVADASAVYVLCVWLFVCWSCDLFSDVLVLCLVIGHCVGTSLAPRPRHCTHARAATRCSGYHRVTWGLELGVPHPPARGGAHTFCWRCVSPVEGAWQMISECLTPAGGTRLMRSSEPDTRGSRRAYRRPEPAAGVWGDWLVVQPRRGAGPDSDTGGG